MFDDFCFLCHGVGQDEEEEGNWNGNAAIERIPVLGRLDPTVAVREKVWKVSELEVDWAWVYLALELSTLKGDRRATSLR